MVDKNVQEGVDEMCRRMNKTKLAKIIIDLLNRKLNYYFFDFKKKIKLL